MYILHRGTILTLACLHSQGVFSYDFGSGSFVAGNLSISAPWSLPADTFASDTKSPDFSASFNVTGYNITANTPSPQSASGWEVSAGVKNDVSLSSSTNSSVDKSSVFEATTLYIQTPTGMTMDASWRMCAVVYPGVVGLNSNITTVDGTCNGALNSGCLQALNIAGSSGTSGMDNGGNCGGFALPERCEGSIPAGNVTAFAINQTVFDEKRFYAFGSMPVSSGNATAHNEAQQNIWPVILIYGHLSSNGQLSSKNAGVQCVRAMNGTTADSLSRAAKLEDSNSATLVLGLGLVLTWILII